MMKWGLRRKKLQKRLPLVAIRFLKLIKLFKNGLKVELHNDIIRAMKARDKTRKDVIHHTQ